MEKEYLVEWDKGREAFLSGNLILARQIFETLSEKGVIEAYAEAANLYEYDFGELKKNNEKSFYWYQRAVREGNSSDGHEGLGRAYYHGLGVDINYDKAKEHLLNASACGSSTANILLGKMHYFGRGVKKDLVIARKYYQKAAVKGNIFALRNIARLDMQRGHRVRGIWVLAKLYLKAYRMALKDIDDPRLRDG